jgi:hypothetical protein
MMNRIANDSESQMQEQKSAQPGEVLATEYYRLNPE